MASHRVYEWVDERTGIKPALDYVLYRRVPKSVGWFFTLGSASLTVFLIQMVSGIFLAMGYTPSNAPVQILVNGSTMTSTEALESVRHLTTSVPFGDILRGFHHWGANAMVIVVFLHMLHSFFCGSYKYPREMTWFVGVFLLLFVLGFSFTGYLLPWDNRAYWATQVGINIGGSAPALGPIIAEILRGGPALGAATLTRFYAIHVLILPTLTGLFIALHLFLIIKIGISGMPRYNEQRSEKVVDEIEIKDIKTGKAFFPYIVVEDAIVSFGVVLVILLLSIFVPVGNTNPADPNNGVDPVSGQRFDPKPEWYFLFLFQFLKVVPSINLGPISLPSAAIGGVIIPTIIILALFLAPVLDRSPKLHPFNRPIASGIMTFMVVAIVGLTIWAFASNSSDTIEDSWQQLQKAGKIQPASALVAGASAAGAGTSSGAASDSVQAGLKLFQSNNCAGCHNGNGTQEGGVGPKLAGDEIASVPASAKDWVRNGAVAPMPKYPASQLSDADLDKIVAYLQSLK
jgi:ubiquinol-cytochrome c reductase cytochrome b subunit